MYQFWCMANRCGIFISYVVLCRHSFVGLFVVFRLLPWWFYQFQLMIFYSALDIFMIVCLFYYLLNYACSIHVYSHLYLFNNCCIADRLHILTFPPFYNVHSCDIPESIHLCILQNWHRFLLILMIRHRFGVEQGL